MSMTKGERSELKQVVKNQFKVLKAEINQRREELQADVKREIADKYRDRDEKQESIQFLVDEKVRECNRAINDVLYEQGYSTKEGSERVWVQGVRIPFSRSDTNALTWQAQNDINAKVAGAYVILQRQEADLLRQLAVDAIESDDARAFLSTIPTVSELVPATRLAELEAAMGTDDR